MKSLRGPLVALVALAVGALVLFQLDRGRSTAARAEDRPDTSSPYQDRLGADTYHHYCETCHGGSGKGDGFNAFNLDPKPPDFSSPAFQQMRTDDQLANAIAGGGWSVGRSAGMPPWGRTLSSREQRVVLMHIRRLGATSLGRASEANNSK